MKKISYLTVLMACHRYQAHFFSYDICNNVCWDTVNVNKINEKKTCKCIWSAQRARCRRTSAAATVNFWPLYALFRIHRTCTCVKNSFWRIFCACQNVTRGNCNISLFFFKCEARVCSPHLYWDEHIVWILKTLLHTLFFFIHHLQCKWMSLKLTTFIFFVNFRHKHDRMT